MKKFSEQLQKKTETVKLRAAERRELKERLVSYMEYHPLPATLKKTVSVKSPTFNDSFKMVSLPFASFFKTSAVAAVILVLVVPLFAERAIPGDTLYAVKVQFNEELRSTLTFDTYQKVAWETERLNRRISEARLLASEGRLTEAVEVEVAEAVRTHTANAKREIEELRTEDADGATIASIELDTTLAVQSTSLKEKENELDSSEGSATTSRPTDLISSVIDESLALPAYMTASSTLPAYDKLMARVEQNTTRVYELLSALEPALEGPQVQDVKRRIEDIERAVLEAIILVDEEEFAARVQLVDVLQRTQRLIVFMTELEVSNTVDIETLVPVVMTEVEEDATRTEFVNDIAKKTATIEASLVDIDDEGVTEKVELALVIVTEAIEDMATTTDFAAFEVIAIDTTTLLDDILMLLEQEQIEVIMVENIATSSENQASSTVDVEVATTTATSSLEIVEEVELPLDETATGTVPEFPTLEDTAATETVSTVEVDAI